MPDGLLSVVLQREHHEIDSAIAAFIEKLDGGGVQPEPLSAALEALRRHIYLEETILFPPIREAGMVMPIFVMMREHGELWRTMGALTDLIVDRPTANSCAIPAIGCCANSSSTTPKRNPSSIRMPIPTFQHR